MAAVGRAQETIIVNDNIYDNNAKEINPEMVRAVMAALIESNFNLVDDELMNLKYSSSLTLAEKFAEGGFLASGTIALGNINAHTIGQTFSCTGSFSTAQVTDKASATDLLYTVTLSPALSTNNYMVISSVRSNDIDFNDDNDLVVSMFKSPSTGSFQFGLHAVSANNNNVTLYVKIVAM